MPEMPKIGAITIGGDAIEAPARDIDFRRTYTFEFGEGVNKVAWHGMKALQAGDKAVFILPTQTLSGIIGVEAIGTIEPHDFSDAEVLAASGAVGLTHSPSQPPWLGSSPSMGSFVTYRLSQRDAELINKRRDNAQDHMHDHVKRASGVIVHVGSPLVGGYDVSMVITCTFPDGKVVNGQCILDGNDTYWVRGAAKGDEPGEWRWPERT